MRQTIMKSGIMFAGLVLVSLLIAGNTWAGIATEVTVNRSAILNLKKPIDRVSLATPGIADIVVITPKQVQINGLSIGKTTLIVWEEASDKPAFYDIKVSGDQASIEEQLKELAPTDTITAQYANDTVILAGKVVKEQTRAKAEKIAQAFALKVLNHIELGEPQQVLLQVKVAQIDRTALTNLGISAIVVGNDAAGLVRTNSSSALDVGGLFGLPTDGVQLGLAYFKGGIGATLQALTTKGFAKILAEPNLLVKSQPPSKKLLKAGSSNSDFGQMTGCSSDEGYACFMAGKKYPINVLQTIGTTTQTTVETLDVGVKLVFHAEVLENGLINLKISPASVSAITGVLAVNGYPIIDIREVNTEVELGDGQSLVMAGLLQEEAIKTMSKIPLLGDIPYIGALFRSVEDDIKERELVFFVTPKIVKPVKTGDELKFIAKEGQKYEMPGDKLPAGMKESDVSISPNQERDIKWIPTVK